jgi:tight adherence protein B
VLGVVIFRQIAAAERQKRFGIVTGDTGEKAEKAQEIQKTLSTSRLKKEKDENGVRKDSIPDLLLQAGFFHTQTTRYWLWSAGTACVMFLFLLMRGSSMFVVVLFTLVAFLGLPRFYLKFKAKRRQKAFLEQFPDALDAMTRLLKAGMPVTEAIAMAGREFEDPVASEMAYIYDQQRIGVSLAAAAEKTSLRMPITEMQMFATAIAIQSETGSSLSEVLGNLSGVIRSRFKLKRKVQALSSEARSSAMIIGALPIMVGLLLRLIRPEYTSLLFDDPTGHLLLWGCAIWMGLGILVMRQMINFRV